MTSSIPGAPGNLGGVNLDSLVEKIKKNFPDATPEQFSTLLSSFRDPNDLTGVGQILSQQSGHQSQMLDKLYGLEAQRAKDAQELGKESAKEAFKYEMLGRIPDTIGAAFTGQGQLMREGSRDIANIMMGSVASIPEPRAAAVTYQRPSFKYFK
jgi:hypothetical protein